MARRVLKLSNELELGLSGVSAKEVLERVGKPFDISREVNPRDCIEMKISMARGLEELNDRLREDMLGLSYRVSKMGGRLYGGGIIFADTSSLDPVWLRTTALSEKCSCKAREEQRQRRKTRIDLSREPKQVNKELCIKRYLLLIQVLCCPELIVVS